MYGAVNKRVSQTAELLGGQGADVRGVDGAQLQRVKNRRGFGNTRGVPDFDHLIQRENLLLTLGRPAQQQQIVQHGGGQVALGNQILVAGIAVALAQLVLRVLHNGRAVDVDGLFPAECLIQQVVLGRAGKILAAADNVGDAHQVVVHDVGKVVGGHTVGLDQNLVVQLLDIDLNVTVHHIVKARHAGFGDFLADDIRLPGSQLGGDFLGAQAAAMPVIVGHFAGGALRLVHFVQALLGAEAVVRLARRDQLLGILLEHPHALALHIGTDGTADVGTLVPSQAGGLQRVVDDVGSALDQAALVGVLNAQDKGAAVVARLQIGIQSRAQVADVHIARGRWRKASANICHSDYPFFKLRIWAITHNSKCRYGERGAAAAKPKAQAILCVLASILATQMLCRSRRSGA